MQDNISCIVNSGMLISQLLQTVYQETSYETRKMIIIGLFLPHNLCITDLKSQILSVLHSFSEKSKLINQSASEKNSLLLNIASE